MEARKLQAYKYGQPGDFVFSPMYNEILIVIGSHLDSRSELVVRARRKNGHSDIMFRELELKHVAR